MILEEFVKHNTAFKAMKKAAKDAIKYGEDEGTYAVVIFYCQEADASITFEGLQVGGAVFLNKKGNLSTVDHYLSLRGLSQYTPGE